MTEQIINAVLIFFGLVSIGCWIRAIVKHGRDLQQIIPQRSRNLPFWNAGDALVFFGLMQIVVGIAGGYLIHRGIIIPKPTDSELPLTTIQTTSNQFAMTWISMIAGCLAMTVMLIWLRMRNSDAFNELGLPIERSDVLLGLKASLMLLPPVLMISGLLSTLVPYQHPVLDFLKSLDSPGRLVLVFLSTAVIAPLVEEFLFRVILIGGLERLMTNQSQIASEGRWRPNSVWPILISSFIFAIMHLGQGAAPIPLFFLAVGLGYLYRRTGNITAPLIVHMVLNSMTLVVETLKTRI